MILKFLMSCIKSIIHTRELKTEEVLESVQDRLEFVAVIYYNKDNPNDISILAQLETVDDECKENDINIVKTSDQDLWSALGIEDSPVLVYYENDVPFVYPNQGSGLADEVQVLKWLIAQRNTAAIEEVTDAMLGTVSTVCGPKIDRFFFDQFWVLIL